MPVTTDTGVWYRESEYAALEARCRELEGILEPGELWSFMRSVLCQGQDIALDYRNKGYEEMSARLDEAARERADKLIGSALETPVDGWQCVCGLTVRKRYTCLCGGRENNSDVNRGAK